MTDDLRPAFHSYRDVDPAAPEGDALNLAWTRDERACLAIDLDAALADELRDELAREPRALDRYLVRDPYGEATLGPAIAAAFELPAWQARITCGAGVVSLLHALARSTSRDAVRVVGDVYPDFPYWAATSRAPAAGAVWFLERPSLAGDAFADLGELAALCDDAARSGAIVIVDESNANYYPPAWSALGLAVARDNLAVLRGFSKAYGLGALRLAFCAASPALTERVRDAVPPLLASSLSLRLGARVLAAGDVAAPLRARVHAHKRATLDVLARAGVDALEPASEHLPYVLSRASRDHLSARLEARGVTGKHHPVYTGDRGSVATIYRLSVPLADDRLARLRKLVG
nr:aminotransferase class I/II-fold pyridoxal phosphate-dependent enzyme [Kofleriaceae bacterium]